MLTTKTQHGCLTILGIGLSFSELHAQAPPGVAVPVQAFVRPTRTHRTELEWNTILGRKLLLNTKKGRCVLGRDD
jgi:hypothetical protein